MKSILLTTTALVAFAGAAAADGHTGVSFGGTSDLTWNSEDGFTYGADLSVTGTAALDNGLTAAMSFGIDVVNDDCEDDLVAPVDGNEYVCWDGFEVSLTSDMAGLYFGDIAPAEAVFDEVDGLALDFNDQTGHQGAFDAVIRGEATMSGITAAVSYGVDLETDTDALDALQVAVSGEFGGVTAQAVYQGELGAAAAMMGVNASTTVAGADVGATFISQDGDSSVGIAVAYPVGPITIGGYYANNSAADNKYGIDVSYSEGPFSVSADWDTDDNDATDPTWEIDANYDTGMGVIVHAGVEDEGNDYYLAGTMDLGGGASLLVSYGVDEDGSEGDEIGEDDIEEGTTVSVSFTF